MVFFIISLICQSVFVGKSTILKLKDDRTKSIDAAKLDVNLPWTIRTIFAVFINITKNVAKMIKTPELSKYLIIDFKETKKINIKH